MSQDEPATLVREPPPDEPGERPFVLTVTRGPDAGKSFAIDGTQPSRVLVGQSPACEIRLTDAEVSRRHAALELMGGALRVKDLGSTNGTFVDRVRIFEAELHGDEYLLVGRTTFQVQRADNAEAPRRGPVGAEEAFGRLIGASRAMRRIYPLCERIAAANVPVIIEGETGTGKEVLAESLHDESPRASGPFVVFDCTVVAPTLMESELFGHERGAFTGAVSSRRGVFEQAEGGTLFIDEIADLDPALQPKLLRAIERSEIRRVGGERWQRVDVRVIAATWRDLDHEVTAGRFREDLFHRLAIARIELPPLRQRQGDVSLLARHFWRELGGDPAALLPDLLRRWEDHPWPGNVRELRNAVARYLALGEFAGDVGSPDSAAAASTAPGRADDPFSRILAAKLSYPEARDRLIEEFEEAYVAQVLAQHGGNVSRAAAASGISRRWFQKLHSRRR